VDQELQSENGLAGARTTHQERGTAAGQASASNFIKTGDARGRFGGHVHGPTSDWFHIFPLRRPDIVSRRERPAIQIQCLKVYVVICSGGARGKKRSLLSYLRPPAKISDILI
jgi:hypothetical protein